MLDEELAFLTPGAMKSHFMITHLSLGGED